MATLQVRLDITLKFNELPKSKEEQSGARTFEVRGESGPRFVVTLTKKAFKKLTTAAEQYPEWLAIVNGRFGEPLGEGCYRLDNAGLVSVMERKPKGTVEEPKAAEGVDASDASAPGSAPPAPAQAAASAASKPAPKPAPKPTAQHAPKPKNRRTLLFRAGPEEQLAPQPPIGRFRSNPVVYYRADDPDPSR